MQCGDLTSTYVLCSARRVAVVQDATAIASSSMEPAEEITGMFMSKVGLAVGSHN